jgi:hypothetical protein
MCAKPERRQACKAPAPAAAPMVWPRADPEALARFDPRTKVCSMNCGPSSADPRTAAERSFLCDECWVVERGVRPLGEATQVTLNLTGRPETLTMPWDRARDLFVRCFGIDAIQDCREALERGHGWTGKSARSGVTLTVDLAA